SALPDSRETREQRRDRRARLDTAEGRPRAEVDPEPEGQVVVRMAGDVESVRIGECLWVAVGGSDRGENGIPRPDRLAANLEVGYRGPRDHLGAAVESEKLLDGLLGERRLGAQPFELATIAQERQHAVADEIDGGLMPREHERAVKMFLKQVDVFAAYVA